ncbi:hypothetical protein, partial [Halorhabdus amylolytica]|uniref:hypothetical protein n=1 Tax=Halorhabdus amylolytica TaxID=2559573 RepID=UPI00145AE3DF
DYTVEPSGSDDSGDDDFYISPTADGSDDDDSDSSGSDSEPISMDTPTTSCPDGMSYSERYGCYDPDLVESGTPGTGSTDDSSEDSSTDSANAGGTGSFGDRGDSESDTSSDTGSDSTDSTTSDSDTDSNSDTTMDTPDGDTIEIITYNDGEAVDTIDTGVEQPDDAGEEYDNRYNADPDLAESGVPGGGDLAVEFISAMAGEPGEGDDGDAVEQNDDGDWQIDPSETTQNVEDELAEVRDFFSDSDGESDQNDGQEQSDGPLPGGMTMPEIQLPAPMQSGSGDQGGVTLSTGAMIAGALGVGAAAWAYSRQEG